MFKNYIRVALRSMGRQRTYAAINVFGLTVGIVSAILITAFIRYELTYDADVPGMSEVYRVVQRQPGNVYLGSDQFVVTPAPLANSLQAEIPEIEAATTFDDFPGLLSIGDNHYYESGLLADESFFDVFGYSLEQGDREEVLSAPNSIVLTRSLAERLFGEADPSGQVVALEAGFSDALDYTVSGIVSDPPTNSHIQFSFVASILANDNYVRSQDRWGNSSWYTYFRVRENQPMKPVESKIRVLPEKYYPDSDPSERREFRVESALSVHLHSNSNFDIAENGDIKFIYLLGAIGLVILILACVNYVNLAITRSVQRVKEVGVRKVVGAMRQQLVAQFLSESILTAAIATALSLVVVAIAMPRFAEFVDRDLAFSTGGLPGIAIMASLFTLGVGLLGGLYPAFVASRRHPARILKGNGASGREGSGLRKTLVTVQFIVSVTLIATTLIIFHQMKFVETQDLGYRRDQVVAVQIQDSDLWRRFSEMEAALERNPSVLAVSHSNSLPTRVTSTHGVDSWTGSEEGDEMSIYYTGVGYDFLEIYEIPLAMGRDFSRDRPLDDSLNAMVINETAFRALGWENLDDKFIGEQPIVGVVKDFHMHSFKLAVMPLMMELSSDRAFRLSIKIAGSDPLDTVAFIEKTLTEMSRYPIEVQFVEDIFEDLYAKEQKFSATVSLFTILALLIGALGLFGLVAYTAETRTKEIGVRKAMGASVSSILRLFAGEYAGLIIVASFIGIPIAYSATSRWLDQFVYRIELGPWDFLIAVGLLVVVAAASMAYQALRAATTDPVKALRYE